MGAIQPEGTESTHVQDSTKLQCPYCDGTECMVSDLMDDPNNITDDTRFAALEISNGDGSKIQGLVVLCSQCGHEWVPYWWTLDIGAATTTTVVMTNLDVGAANALDGMYAIPLFGTDAGDYFVIASHTVNDPTTLTLEVAATGDEDELWMITNLLPVGVTLHSN